jgi:hypothetical protein
MACCIATPQTEVYIRYFWLYYSYKWKCTKMPSAKFLFQEVVIQEIQYWIDLMWLNDNTPDCNESLEFLSGTSSPARIITLDDTECRGMQLRYPVFRIPKKNYLQMLHFTHKQSALNADRMTPSQTAQDSCQLRQHRCYLQWLNPKPCGYINLRCRAAWSHIRLLRRPIREREALRHALAAVSSSRPTLIKS